MVMFMVMVMVTKESVTDLLAGKEGNSPCDCDLDRVGDAQDEGPRAKAAYSPADTEENRPNN